MKFLAYLLAYPLIWLLSVLPFRLLYLISDVVFLKLYYLLGYRKNVVRSNLELVFPEKSTTELRRIEKKFYRHLCDMFLESTKSRSISARHLTRRYEIVNPEVLNDLEGQRSVMLYMSHYANWEWSVILGHYVKTSGYGVYQRLGNPYFDRYVRRTRARWNLELIEQQEATKKIIAHAETGHRGVYGLLSDQSPMLRKSRVWMPFMGITVPVFTGAEYLARAGKMGVLYAKVNRKKRGYYSLELVPITDRAGALSENEITRRYLQLCESQIREKPELYFWTHRRWKHRNKMPEAHGN